MGLCTVIGNVKTILAQQSLGVLSLFKIGVSGTVQFTLVNLGSNNVGLNPQNAQVPVIRRAFVNNDGSFIITIEANDGIKPANTFYQVGIFVPGIAETGLFYLITGSSLNLNFATPLSASQVAALAPLSPPPAQGNFTLLTLQSTIVANLPASAPNGSLAYAADATPGSNPASGGGTGALVVMQNGQWVAK